MLTVKILQGLPDIILALKGELDLTTAYILREAVEQFDPRQVRSISFSLNGLEFLDSTGVGQLIGYYRTFAEQEIPVYIDNNNEAIEEILQLIGVREIMSS